MEKSEKGKRTAKEIKSDKNTSNKFIPKVTSNSLFVQR